MTTPEMPTVYLIEKGRLIGQQAERLAGLKSGFIPADDITVRILRHNAKALLIELDEWAPEGATGLGSARRGPAGRETR